MCSADVESPPAEEGGIEDRAGGEATEALGITLLDPADRVFPDEAPEEATRRPAVFPSAELKKVELGGPVIAELLTGYVFPTGDDEPLSLPETLIKEGFPTVPRVPEISPATQQFPDACGASIPPLEDEAFCDSLFATEDADGVF